MEVKKIDIHIIFESNESGQDTFFDIIHNNAGSAWEFYELDPEGFWGLSGGIEIVINGFNSIFRSTDFHYLLKPVSFLLHTLYYIKDLENTWFDKDELYPDSILLKTTGQNILKLDKVRENVKLSFLNQQGHTVKSIRGDQRYFDDIYIDSKLWHNATHIALEEYFISLLQIVKVFPDSKTSNVMMNFHKVWHDLNEQNPHNK